MKKILTFLMMFAMTASILSAQGQTKATAIPSEVQNPQPTLSYQVVVRDGANNLVHNQPVNVTVVISENNNPVYTEQITGTTNNNGMVNLTIGQGQPNSNNKSLSDIDWNVANVQMEVVFQEGEDFNAGVMTVNETVYAVPLAMEAEFLLTTDQIVNYLTDPTTNGESVEAIYQAMKANSDLHDAMREITVNYIKEHFYLAKEVAYYYLSHLKGDDVREAYDELKSLNADVKQAIYDKVEEFIKNHRGMAVDLAKYFVRTGTPDEIQHLAEVVQGSAAWPYIDGQVSDLLTERMRYHRLDTACLSQYGYQNLCDLKAASEMVAYDPNDSCPKITSVMNTANAGLVSLALNGGVVMTAYMKNAVNNNPNAQHGFLLSESPIDAYDASLTEGSITYVPLTNNGVFGKIVDTMDNTANCGKTLYARAYLTNHKAGCEAGGEMILSDPMSYKVPSFEIEVGNGQIKASPDEADQVFSADNNGSTRYQTNVKWYAGDTATGPVVSTGRDYPTTPGTYTVEASLRNCKVTRTIQVQ